MQTYLYRLTLTRPEQLISGSTEAESAAVSAHFYRLKQLMEEGIVVLAGRTANDNEPDEVMGLVIFRSSSDESARAMMMSDPAVVAGVMTAKLYPYGIALISEKNAG